MVEFVSRYEKFEGLEYDPRVIGHGAVYGSSQSGKSHLVRQLCLNGMFRHCKTLVFLNGKCSKMSPSFVQTMKSRWDTLVYSYQIVSEPQLIAKINEIEDAFLEHRSIEYKSLRKSMPEEVDMRAGMEFGNLKIIMDDLHKEVVKSETLARKFQSVRHSGIELLFVTQSFKNTNMHDLIKENLMFVIVFKLSQNKVTLNGYLSDLSMISSRSRATNVRYRSSLEYIYNRLVLMNDSILGFAPDETSYLYVAMPKRSCKKVSDVRTAITNPNVQVCFKEIDCNSCKILFAERKTRLNYGNRMKVIPMKVMSEREQAERFQNASVVEPINDSEQTTRDEFPKGNYRHSDSEYDQEDDKNDVEYSGKTGFSGSKNNNKNKRSNRERRGSSSSESRAIRYSDFTEISSEEDEIYHRENPLRVRMKKKHKTSDTKTSLTHSARRSRKQSPSRELSSFSGRKRRIGKLDGRCFGTDQTPIRKQSRGTNSDNRQSDGFNSNGSRANVKRKRQAVSTPANSDFDE